MEALVAHWRTRHGRYWYKLYLTETGYRYTSDNGGGNIGDYHMTEHDVLAIMREKIQLAKAIDGRNLKLCIG